ncbi:MAG TPA: hypothetical protein VKB38_23135 [Terracidiphilus sp.]|nr:hypothetical protein [Terracidiphilus sp.]
MTSPIQQALYAAFLSLDACPDVDEAERLWIRGFALRLIAELAVLRSDANAAPQPEEATVAEVAAA